MTKKIVRCNHCNNNNKVKRGRSSFFAKIMFRRKERKNVILTIFHYNVLGLLKHIDKNLTEGNFQKFKAKEIEKSLSGIDKITATYSLTQYSILSIEKIELEEKRLFLKQVSLNCSTAKFCHWCHTYVCLLFIYPCWEKIYWFYYLLTNMISMETIFVLWSFKFLFSEVLSFCFLKY